MVIPPPLKFPPALINFAKAMLIKEFRWTKWVDNLNEKRKEDFQTLWCSSYSDAPVDESNVWMWDIANIPWWYLISRYNLDEIEGWGEERHLLQTSSGIGILDDLVNFLIKLQFAGLITFLYFGSGNSNKVFNIWIILV